MKKILLMIVACCVVLISFEPMYALTEEEAAAFAQQAYEKALASAKKQDTELASMYFVNALAFAPGRIDIITDYASMIVGQAKRDTSLPSDTLDALDSFLNAQIMTVKPDDLPKIIELRETVSKIQEGIMNKALSTQKSSSKVDVAREVKKFKEKAAGAKTLKDYLGVMQAAQEFVEEYSVDDPEISENFQAAVMLDSGIRQVEDLLSRANIDALEPLQMYYLQLAEASLQQLIALSVKLPVAINQELLSVKTRVETQVNEVSEKRSAAVLEQIRKEYAEVAKANQGSGSQQQKIDRLDFFVQTLTGRAQEISSMEYSEKLRKMMEEIQQQLLSYRAEQEKQYNRWAVNQLDAMMEEAKEHDRTLYKGKFRDEDKMCAVMIKRLSSIDTRLLNFGAQHCFNRVYEEYYGKLDSENQKKVDSAMAFDKKLDLTDF